MPSTMVKSFFLMLLLAVGQTSASDTKKGTKTDDCDNIAGLYWRQATYNHYYGPNDDGFRQMYITQQGCNIQVVHGPKGSYRPYKVYDGSVNGSAISISNFWKKKGKVLKTGDILMGRDNNPCLLLKGGGIWKKQECHDATGWKDLWGNNCNHYATTSGACNSPCLGGGCASQHCCACGGGSVITTTTTTLITQVKCWAPTTCNSQKCEAEWWGDGYGSPPELLPVFANTEPLICGDSPLNECSDFFTSQQHAPYDPLVEYCCGPASCYDFAYYNESSKKYEPWYDARGREYNCSWYAAAPEACLKYVDSALANFGHIAAEACCACGGSNTCKDIVPPGQTKWAITTGHSPSVNCASKEGRDLDGPLCDEKIYKDGGYTSSEACCKCGGGLSKDEPQPSTVCVDRPGWTSKGSTCADVNRDVESGYEDCSYWSCTWPWETCATEACCACGGGSQVEYSTTTTTTWVLCMEAKQCKMHACPDGYVLKPESTTYCDDRLLEAENSPEECTVADKFPWRSIRKCQLTTDFCGFGICWDPEYGGFDDCCQIQPASPDKGKCFGKPRLCSAIQKEEQVSCYDPKIVRKDATLYCNSSSDSPLVDCGGDVFRDSCCHFEQKQPSMVVAEYNLQEYGYCEYHCSDAGIPTFEECSMICSLDSWCTCMNFEDKVYVKSETTKTTTALMQDLCVEPNFPCNSYLCPAGFATTSNYVYEGKPFKDLYYNWHFDSNGDADGGVWDYDAIHLDSVLNFNTCCEPEKPLSVGKCPGHYKITQVLDGGSSFKLGCVGDPDYSCYCGYWRNGESCSADCAVSGCVCDIPKSDLVKTDSKCEYRDEYDASLANPKHADKGKKRERRGAKNERLANSSLGQKRSRREEMQLAEKNRVQKLKLAKEKKVQKLKDAEKKRVQKLKDAKTNKRAKAKASPTKTQLLLIAIFSGMAVSAGLVLVIKRRLQRRTVHVPEAMLG